MPLVVLLWKLKESKKVDPFLLSREGLRNPILPCKRDEGGWMFIEERSEQVPCPKVFATGSEDLL